MENMRVEKWVKIRAVMDMIACQISSIKNRKTQVNTALDNIRGFITEVLGRDIAEEVHRLILENMDKDTGEILSKVQQLLIDRVIGGGEG